MAKEINLNTYAGKILFSVVRIDSRKKGKGEPATGFIVSEKIDETSTIPLLITNKHVIDGADEITISFIKSDGQKPILGQEIKCILKNPKNYFFNHPDTEVDLTTLPLAPLLN